MTTTDQKIRMLRLKDILDRVRLGRATVYREMAGGRFPAAVKIGRSSFWLEHEIDSWLEARIAESRGSAHA